MKQDTTKKVLTTHEAARLLFVTPSTAIQWIKDGKIKTMRTVGGHRRIPREEIERFIEKNKLFLDRENLKSVLIISDDLSVIQKATINTYSQEKYRVFTSSSIFECGFLFCKIQADIVMIDEKIGSKNINEICDYITYIDKNIKIIAIVDDPLNIEKLNQFKFDQFYKRG